MKKKFKQSILFSLLSLSLISCGRNSNSLPNTGNSQQQSSDKTSVNSTQKPSTSTTQSTTPSTSPSTSTSTSTSNSNSTPDTPDTPNQDEDLWGEDLSAIMKQHLGGEVLPYVNLGRGADGGWKRNIGDYGVLTITGNKFAKSMLDEANTTYTARGWACTVNATTFTATLADKHLNVKLTDDGMGYAQITATFDEPFDKTTSTAWDEATLSSMHKSLGGHELPFVYLGMRSPDCSFDNRTKTFGIDGGKWDDSVLDDAVAALQAAGYQNVKKVTQSYGVVASGEFTFEDGCYIGVEIYKGGADTAPFPHLSAFYKEKFEAPTDGKWPSDITSRFNSSFDGHALPYIYLGTNTLSYDWNNEVKKLTIDGGATDSRIFANAKTTLTADGFTCVDEMNADGNQKSLISSKKMDGGCTIVAVLFAGAKLVNLDVYYYDPLTVPATSTAFDEAITQKIDQYIDGHSAEIPFVYLGTDKLATDYDNYDEALTITGDEFNGAMIDNAKTSFEATGYTVTIASDASFGRVFLATKTLTDKCTITVRMDSGYGPRSAAMTISYVEGFNVPATTDEWGKWSSDVTSAMEDELGGYTLPYFYLGAKNPTLKQSSKTIELTGKTWDNQILTLAKTALGTMDGFTWTFKDGIDRLDAEGKDEKGNTITIALYKNSKNKPYLKATYLKSFVVPANGAWTDGDTDETKIKSLMVTNFKEVLPYVYLGTETPIADFYNGELNITGETWDDQIFNLARTAFTADGYTLSSGTSIDDAGEMVTAYKKTDDSLIRVAVYQDRYGTANYKAVVETAADIPSDVTTWSDKIQAQMTSYMGSHDIPFFYTGAKDPSMTLKTYSTLGKRYLQLSSFKEWNNGYAINAERVLKAAGWDVKLYAMQNSSYSGSRFEANHTYADGATVSMILKAGYSSPVLCIAYQDPFVIHEETTEWSVAVTNAMESSLNGYKLPYFYLGTDDPSVSVDTTYHNMTLVGGIWNEQIFTNAEAALRKDTTFNWTVLYDYSYNDNTTGKTLIASAEDTAHNKHLTLRLYGMTSGTRNSFGVVAPVVELSYN